LAIGSVRNLSSPFTFYQSVFVLSHAFGLLPGFFVLIISAIFSINFLDYIYVKGKKQ